MAHEVHTKETDERQTVVAQEQPRVEEPAALVSGARESRPQAECLYCRIPLPDTAEFCPRCGRPIERGFAIRPIQESEFDGLGKDEGN
jgi:hypothetical protein